MERKEEEIDITDNNSIKTLENQIQSPNNSNNYLCKKRKPDEINLFNQNLSNSRKTSLDKIFEPNKETLNSKPSTDKYNNYKVEEMTEKDKELMACFNVVKSKPERELNKEIVLNILNKETTLILQKRTDVIFLLIDNQAFYFDNFTREIIFVNEKKELKIKKFIYNTKKLRSSLKELEFTTFYVKMPQDSNNRDNID